MPEENFNRLETLLVSLTDTISHKFKEYNYTFDRIEQRLKTLELDIEPDGRISEAFSRLEIDLDQMNKRLDRLEHGQNEIKAALGVIMERLTGWNQDNI
jgi:predicted  nucleic acid-binding Zn-ribbon protein